MSDTTLSLIGLSDTSLVSEDELLDRAREGDRSAFGTLYLRHRDAARKVAGMCATTAADAEDAVAEGFARVFAALPRMAGRTIAFRPYLLTAVRNAATDRLRRERRIDLRESMPETAAALQADDVALLGLERNLVGEALQALPARWRTVLWLTEVEGLSPAEVSRRIGIKPNAVAALAYRARKGLREAYLQAHLRAEASQECRGTVARLGNYVRGELSEKDRTAIQVHLDSCAKCRCRRDELTDVNATLRHAFLPLPMLLATMAQRRWLDLGSQTWWKHAPELAQAAQGGDSPVVQKALAGIGAAVLAITGAVVPRIHEPGNAQTAAQDPKVALYAQTAAAGAPSVSSTPTTEVAGSASTRGAPTQAKAGTGTADGGSGQADPAGSAESVRGGTRSTLISGLSGRRDGGSDSGDGQGLLGSIPDVTPEPVQALVGTAVETLDQVLPSLSTSLPSLDPQTLATVESLLGLDLGIDLSTVSAPGGTALAGLPLIGELLQPLLQALTGSVDSAPACDVAGANPTAGLLGLGVTCR
jgi:RNA polymerase sigma factor (sigma-70 family)